MKLTNIGYVAKMNKQKSKKGQDRSRFGGARGSCKSGLDLERFCASLESRNRRGAHEIH